MWKKAWRKLYERKLCKDPTGKMLIIVGSTIPRQKRGTRMGCTEVYQGLLDRLFVYISTILNLSFCGSVI